MRLLTILLLGIGITARAFALPEGNWKLDWSDEFDGPAGALPADHWILGATNWSNVPYQWRDATLSRDEAFLDGQGRLIMRARCMGGKRLCPYLVTRENTHPDKSYAVGPGENGIYIECRVNVAQFKAWGAWFAFWLMSDHPYTGDPKNGSEIDVMEYAPYYCDRYTLMDKFHTGVIAGHGHDDQPAKNELTRTDEYGQTVFDETKWNTWGLEWYKDRQIFTLNGKKFWENTKWVSTDTTHSLRLTIEIQNQDPRKKTGHQMGKFEDNPPDRLPSIVAVDYIRVYKRIR